MTTQDTNSAKPAYDVVKTLTCTLQERRRELNTLFYKRQYLDENIALVSRQIADIEAALLKLSGGAE